MENNFLMVYGQRDNKYMNYLLNGLEEQGIKFEILTISELKNINVNKLPFNIAIEISTDYIKVISKEFNEDRFCIKGIDEKNSKAFGLDVGRYIKRLPLKGDWYE